MQMPKYSWRVLHSLPNMIVATMTLLSRCSGLRQDACNPEQTGHGSTRLCRCCLRSRRCQILLALYWCRRCRPRSHAVRPR
jgi:hypothetical protein